MEDISQSEEIFFHLKVICEVVPVPIYWTDRHGVILGLNHLVLDALGISSRGYLLGKKIYEFHPPKIADHIVSHNEKVMHSGKTLTQEEWIKDFTTERIKYFSVVKTPLFDKNSKVIGMLGTAIEITSEKEVERLRIQEKTLIEQERLRKAINHAVSDIRSPIANLFMLTKHCNDLPEHARIALKQTAIGINDIAGNLLNALKTKEIFDHSKMKNENNFK